jgi:hypothetical protein
MRLQFILLCLPLLALDNSVTIHEASGSSQAARPTTIYRSFAQGEFATGTYPKPRIGGNTPSAWQVDVKTTWPDGSVMAAYVSFRLDLTANGSAVVDFVRDSNPCHLGNLATCQAAALTQVQMLNYDTGTGNGTWGAAWSATVNGIEYTTSSRTMLTAGAWRYWLQGPVVTGVIVEDRSTALSHDFGWQYTGGAWAAPSSNTYKSLHPVFEVRFYPDPDGAGALTAWGGVEVDAQLWNASTTRLQRFDSIDLTLKTGNPESTPAYTVTGKSFHARSRRHKLAWSGTAPGAVVVDYNFQYLIHTKLIPSYDYSLGVASSLANTSLSAYATNLGGDEPQWCSMGGFCANWQKSVGGTGARGEIALVARWYLDYLYLMGHSGVTAANKKNIWDKLVIGNADAGGHAPFHYMETGTGLTFFNLLNSTDAFGRIGSINARPGWYAYNTSEVSVLTPACPDSPCDARMNASVTPYHGSWTAQGWTNYISHAPSIYAIPAFLTGYHYYLTGAQFEASYVLGTANSCTTASYGCRQGTRGIFWYNDALRGRAWALRNIYWAAILTPDADIERAYFIDKLKANAAYEEGVYLMRGAHTPADMACPSYVLSDATAPTADMWCAGRNFWSFTRAIPPSNPLYLSQHGGVWGGASDGMAGNGGGVNAIFQSYTAAVPGWLASIGAILDKDNRPIFTHVKNAKAAHMAGRTLSSPTSMYMMRGLYWSTNTSSAWPTDWSVFKDAWVTSYTLGADMTSSQTTLVVNSLEFLTTSYSWLSTSWAKIDNEYVRLSGSPSINNPAAGKSTLPIMQRGIWGSTATTHAAGATVTWLPGFWDTYTTEYTGGYSILPRAVLALLADADQIGEYSPRTAYHVYSEALPYQTYKTNPLWATVPRERVENIQRASGSGRASLRWTAPTGEACRVYFGIAPPPSSNDASDPLADAPGRVQSFERSALQPGTYHYRISCRTARASGTFLVEP